MRALWLSLLILASPALADVITLTDGTRLDGDVKREDDQWKITTTDGQVLFYSANQVKSIEMKGRTVSADARLASFRRSVENLADIQQIIDRYQKFIEQNQNTPIAAEAAQDLVMWKDRQAKGLVKVAGRWITREEQEQLHTSTILIADQARGLIKQGRIKEANALLADCLAKDPNNATALYLRGYLLLKQEQFPAARKAFEAVAMLVPDHGPTLNNLAIILYRQNQIPASMGMYEKAMLARPNDVRILTNVAEALHALAGSAQNLAPVQKAYREFVAQQAVLEPEMLTRGYHRWGAGYISREDYEKLTEADRLSQERLDAIKADRDKTTAQLTVIAGSIQNDQTLMRRMEIDRYVTDSQGRAIEIPLPQQYYDLQNDVRRLLQQQAEAAAHLKQLDRDRLKEQNGIATGKYTGMQTPIGEEGTPLAVAVPSSQPTTRAGGG